MRITRITKVEDYWFEVLWLFDNDNGKLRNLRKRAKEFFILAKEEATT